MCLTILKIHKHCITPIWAEQYRLLKALRCMMLQQIRVLVGLRGLTVVALDLEILQLTVQGRMDLLWLHVFFATGWTCVVSAQPILHALLAVWLEAVAALLGLVEQVLADGAAEVLWHLIVQICDVFQKLFVIVFSKTKSLFNFLNIIFLLETFFFIQSDIITIH